MKARGVGVNPDGSFRGAVSKTLEVRLAELDSFDPEGDAEELHHMRIAAKRVRYVLEVAEPVAPGTTARVKAAKRIQDLLGEIHDCDELLPMVERHVARLREEDAEAARAGEQLPNRRKYRGLEALRAHTIARRAHLRDEFVSKWPKLRKRLDAREAVAA
jgi:CHAD domain-containing protein